MKPPIARFAAPRACILAAWLAAVLPFPLARATTYTWDGGLSHSNVTVNNDWTTPNNWAGGLSPASASDTDLEFAGSAFRTTSNNDIADPFTLRSLTFDAGTTAYTLTGGALDLDAGGLTQNSTASQTINNTVTLTADQTWTLADGTGALTFGGGVDTGNQTLTINAATTTGTGNILNANLSDGTVTKIGAGILTLNGTNTFEGSLTVNAGVLAVSSNNALGRANFVTIGGGELLATRSFTLDTDVPDGQGTDHGNVVVPAGQTGTISAASGVTLSIGEQITIGNSSKGIGSNLIIGSAEHTAR